MLDKFPKLRETPRRKAYCFGVFSIFCIFLGLPFVCPGGPKLLSIFDNYIATWAMMMMAILECVTVVWLYGYTNWAKDMKMMCNWLPERYFKIYLLVFCGIIAPGVLLVRDIYF